MKRFEILDLIEDLGFPYLVSILDSNECTPINAIEHLNNCKNECSEEEFPSSVYDEMIDLLNLYFSL